MEDGWDRGLGERVYRGVKSVYCLQARRNKLWSPRPNREVIRLSYALLMVNRICLYFCGSMSVFLINSIV